MKKHTIRQMESSYEPWIVDEIEDLTTCTKNGNPIFISGNREFMGINGDTLNDLIQDLEDCISDCDNTEVFDNPESLDKPEDVVGYYFDNLHEKKLDKMIELVKKTEWITEKTVLEYLSLYYGEAYKTATIRGYCQSEWNTIYYPASEPNETIDYIEALYFGKYDEFCLEEEGCSAIVMHDNLWKDPKKAVAEAFNLNPEEVEIEVYTITGYRQVPTYQSLS